MARCRYLIRRGCPEIIGCRGTPRHTAGVTSGNVHDAKLMDRLIRDDDTAVYGDKG